MLISFNGYAYICSFDPSKPPSPCFETLPPNKPGRYVRRLRLPANSQLVSQLSDADIAKCKHQSDVITVELGANENE